MKASICVRVALVFMAALGFYQSATACSCAKPSLEQALKESSAVFSGKVIGVSRSSTSAKIEVYKFWKGAPAKTVAVVSVPAACGYYFEKGHEYLVYASGDNKKLSTNMCTRTKELSQAKEDLEKLGEGTEVKKEAKEADAQQ